MKTFIAFWLPALVLVAVVVVVGFLWLQEPKGPQPGHASPYVPMLKEAPKPLFSTPEIELDPSGKNTLKAYGTDCKVEPDTDKSNEIVDCDEFSIFIYGTPRSKQH